MHELRTADVLALAVIAYMAYGSVQQQALAARVSAIRISPQSSSLLLGGSRLPYYFKWKEKLLMPVRNQAGCASCWAFALVDTLADTLNLRSGGAWTHGHLSPQYLLSCTKIHYGCSRGGSPEDAYNLPALTVEGVPLEAALPYVHAVTQCPAIPAGLRVRTGPGTMVELCVDPASVPLGFQQKTIAQNVLNMKRALLEFGPILGTLRITQELYDYKGASIFKAEPASPTLGMHAIEIVGWSEAGANSAEPGFDGPYWVVRQSWGAFWGTPTSSQDGTRMKYGFGYIAMGSNESDIESRASICRVQVPDFLQAATARASMWNSAYTSYQEYVHCPDRQLFLDPERQAYLEQLHYYRKQARAVYEAFTPPEQALPRAARSPLLTPASTTAAASHSSPAP